MLIRAELMTPPPLFLVCSFFSAASFAVRARALAGSALYCSGGSKAASPSVACRWIGRQMRPESAEPNSVMLRRLHIGY